MSGVAAINRTVFDGTNSCDTQTQKRQPGYSSVSCELKAVFFNVSSSVSRGTLIHTNNNKNDIQQDRIANYQRDEEAILSSEAEAGKQINIDVS